MLMLNPADVVAFLTSAGLELVLTLNPAFNVGRVRANADVKPCRRCRGVWNVGRVRSGADVDPCRRCCSALNVGRV